MLCIQFQRTQVVVAKRLALPPLSPRPTNPLARVATFRSLTLTLSRFNIRCVMSLFTRLALTLTLFLIRNSFLNFYHDRVMVYVCDIYFEKGLCHCKIIKMSVDNFKV